MNRQSVTYERRRNEWGRPLWLTWRRHRNSLLWAVSSRVGIIRHWLTDGRHGGGGGCLRLPSRHDRRGTKQQHHTPDSARSHVLAHREKGERKSSPKSQVTSSRRAIMTSHQWGHNSLHDGWMKETWQLLPPEGLVEPSYFLLPVCNDIINGSETWAKSEEKNCSWWWWPKHSVSNSGKCQNVRLSLTHMEAEDSKGHDLWIRQLHCSYTYCQFFQL